MNNIRTKLVPFFKANFVPKKAPTIIDNPMMIPYVKTTSPKIKNIMSAAILLIKFNTFAFPAASKKIKPHNQKDKNNERTCPRAKKSIIKC